MASMSQLDPLRARGVRWTRKEARKATVGSAVFGSSLPAAEIPSAVSSGVNHPFDPLSFGCHAYR